MQNNKQNNHDDGSNNGDNDNVPHIENQSAGADEIDDFQVIETFEMDQ